jgi:hypothetical protein
MYAYHAISPGGALGVNKVTTTYACARLHTHTHTHTHTCTHTGTNSSVVSVLIHSKYRKVLTHMGLLRPDLKPDILYILESNTHTFYSFRGPKSWVRIRFACILDSCAF